MAPTLLHLPPSYPKEAKPQAIANNRDITTDRAGAGPSVSTRETRGQVKFSPRGPRGHSRESGEMTLMFARCGCRLLLFIIIIIAFAVGAFARIMRARLS